MKLFTATLSIASISSAIRLSQLDWFADEEITDRAKAVAQELFDMCDTNDDDVCTDAEKNALFAPLNELQDKIDELHDEIYDWEGDSMQKYPECDQTGESWDWYACDWALHLELEAEKADLYKANQIPDDLEDIEEIFWSVGEETTDG